jgi:hypothetical protein
MNKIVGALVLLLGSATLAQAQYYGPYGTNSAEPSNPYYGPSNNAPQPYQMPPPPPLPYVPPVYGPMGAPSQGPANYPCTMPGCR